MLILEIFCFDSVDDKHPFDLVADPLYCNKAQTSRHFHSSVAKITHLVFSSEVSGLQAWKWAEKSRCKWVVTPLKWCHGGSVDELLHFQGCVNVHCKSSRIGSVVF